MRLSNKDFVKIAIRSYLIRLFYNYKSLFGEGLCYCLLSYARKKNKNLICSYTNDKAEIEICNLLNRHMGFFNANEYLVCVAIGIILRLEEQKQYEKLKKIKTVLKSTLGAIGDNLIYKIIKPILVFYPIVIIFLYNFKVNLNMILLLIIPYLIFNIFNFIIRFYGAKLGYIHGLKSLKYFKSETYHHLIKYLSNFTLLLFFLSQILISYHLLFRYSNINNELRLNPKDLGIILILSFGLLFFRKKSKLNANQFNCLLVIILLILPTIYCFL